MTFSNKTFLKFFILNDHLNCNSKYKFLKCYLVLAYLIIIGITNSLNAQTQSTLQFQTNDSVNSKEISYFKHQRDLIDIGYLVLGKNINMRIDSTHTKSSKIKISASPILEYTISTGVTSGIAANGAFYTSIKKQTNISSFLGAVKYTQKKQFLLPVQTTIWTPGNKYNFLGDWRYLNFPQDTYGIGGSTTTANQYTVSYKYLRFYEMFLKKISNNFYIGTGYQLDHHWGITELLPPEGSVTDFKKYGYNQKSTSSGIAFTVVYDSRKNSINPEGGSVYGGVQFLQNSKILGSNTNWNSLLIDLRKYVTIGHKKNVLAFWFYSVLTLSGNPPYLDLPGSGADTYNNTGRGYENGRFIGKKYMDFETEFRFIISNNGLLGGVIFCNAASVSERTNNKFEKVYPGIGAGLRIKFNKFSNTNTCLDYGFGQRKSRGFSGNLGEVF